MTPTAVKHEMTSTHTTLDGDLLKRCTCCGRWLAWQELPVVGEQWDGVSMLSLRNCNHCGSTLAVELWVDVVAYHHERASELREQVYRHEQAALNLIRATPDEEQDAA